MTSLDPPLEIQMNKRTHAIGMVFDKSLFMARNKIFYDVRSNREKYRNSVI